MYTSSASNSLASRARNTFTNGRLHGTQSHPTNCSLATSPAWTQCGRLDNPPKSAFQHAFIISIIWM